MSAEPESQDMAEAWALIIAKRNGGQPPEYVPGATAVVIEAPAKQTSVQAPARPPPAAKPIGGVMARPPQAAVEAGLIGAITSPDRLLEIQQAGIGPQSFVAWGDLFGFIISHQQQYQTLPTADQMKAVAPDWQPPDGDFRYWLDSLLHYIKVRRAQAVLRDNLELLESDPAKGTAAMVEKLAALNLEQAVSEGLPLPVTVAEFVNRDWPTDLWMVQGHLARTGHHVFVGSWSTGKSLITVDLALAVSSGQDFLGTKTEQAPVLFIDEDTPPLLLQERFQLQARGRGLDLADLPLWLLAQAGVDCLNDRWIEHLITQVKAHGCKLVILEALRRIFSGEENSSDDISALNRQLTRMRSETGATDVVTHHLPKNQPGATSRGSGDIEAGADVVLLHRFLPGGYSVTQKKNRWSPELLTVQYEVSGGRGDPLKLIVKTHGFADPHEAEEESQVSQCVEYLYDELDDGQEITKQALEEKARRHGYKPRIVDRALAKPRADRTTVRNYPDVHERSGPHNTLILWRDAASVSSVPVFLGKNQTNQTDGDCIPPSGSLGSSLGANGETTGATESPPASNLSKPVTGQATGNPTIPTDDVPPDDYLKELNEPIETVN